MALDPESGAERLLLPEGWVGSMVYPVCSPDGARAAAFGKGAGGEVGLHLLDQSTGEVELVLESNVAVPRTWPQGGFIYFLSGKVAEEGGDATFFQIPGSEMDLGAGARIEAVSPDASQALLSIPLPPSSDIYLIEYGGEGET